MNTPTINPMDSAVKRRPPIPPIVPIRYGHGRQLPGFHIVINPGCRRLYLGPGKVRIGLYYEAWGPAYQLGCGGDPFYLRKLVWKAMTA